MGPPRFVGYGVIDLALGVLFSSSSSSSSFPPSVFLLLGLGVWGWRVKLRRLTVEFGSIGFFCFFVLFCCFFVCFCFCFVC